MNVKGYDGREYGVGDRVEIHPSTDLWVRGARYGTVTGLRTTPKDRVRVEMDNIKGRTFAGSAETFRAISVEEKAK